MQHSLGFLNYNLDTDLGSISLADNEAEQFTINGRLLDCDGEHLEGGIIKVTAANSSLYSLSNEQGPGYQMDPTAVADFYFVH